MTDVAEFVARSRREQGLPTTITDPAFRAWLAILLNERARRGGACWLIERDETDLSESFYHVGRAFSDSTPRAA